MDYYPRFAYRHIGCIVIKHIMPKNGQLQSIFEQQTRDALEIKKETENTKLLRLRGDRALRLPLWLYLHFHLYLCFLLTL